MVAHQAGKVYKTISDKFGLHKSTVRRPLLPSPRVVHQRGVIVHKVAKYPRVTSLLMFHHPEKMSEQSENSRESQEKVGHAARQRPKHRSVFYQRMVKVECFGMAGSKSWGLIDKA